MIITEPIIIANKQFTKTYSDSNFMIGREGALYSEAIDPSEFNREYIETNIPINPESSELTLDDALEALNDMGVSTDDQQTGT